jgi:predicted Zn-dependent peptidase
MYEDDPRQMVGDVFEELLYGKNPLGRDIAGSKKTVAKQKRKNFLDYIKRHYVPNDTVMCVAGRIKEKEVIRSTKKYFSKMKKRKKPVCQKVGENQKPPRVKIKFKKTDQTHLLLGNRAYDFNHKDRFALALLSVILGGNMSSRLFTEVREKRGLAYYIQTGVEAYEDCGYIATHTGVEHKNLSQVVKIIIGEYRKVVKERVSSKELKIAKEYIRGKSVMGFEESDLVANFYGDQELKRGKIMTLPELIKSFNKVTADDIIRVAKDIFINRKLNLAVIGPHRNSQNLEKILRL